MYLIGVKECLVGHIFGKKGFPEYVYTHVYGEYILCRSLHCPLHCPCNGMDELQCNCIDNRKKMTLSFTLRDGNLTFSDFPRLVQFCTRKYDPDLDGCIEGSKASNRLMKDELTGS